MLQNLQYPQSREAEEALVGAVLVSPESFPTLSNTIRSSDFHSERLRWIWATFEQLASEGKAIDIMMVCDKLTTVGKIDELGGMSYLVSLLNQTPYSGNADSYAMLVSEYSVRRHLLDAANKMAQLAYNYEEPIDNILSVSDNTLRKVMARGAHSNTAQRAGAYLDETSPPQKFFPSPWPRLNSMMRGGMATGELNLIAARPGDGKTALMINEAVTLGVRHNIPVVMFSLEMKARSVVNRMLSYLTSIDSEKIDTNNLSNTERGALVTAGETLKRAPIYIDDDPDITASAFLNRCRYFKHSIGAEAVFLDYIQLVIPEGRMESREQQVSYVSHTLKRASRELDISVNAAAQLNRAVEQRVKGEPQLSDLRESGSLEQDADSVYFLWRTDTEVGRIGTFPARVVHTKLAKNRNGKIGVSTLLHRPDTHLFVEALREERPQRVDDND